MKKGLATIASILILAVVGLGTPVVLDILDETGTIELPPENDITRGVERTGETIREAISLDKEEFNKQLAKERIQEMKEIGQKIQNDAEFQRLTAELQADYEERVQNIDPEDTEEVIALLEEII